MGSNQSSASQQTEPEPQDTFRPDVTQDPDFAKFMELRKNLANDSNWDAVESGPDSLIDLAADEATDPEFNPHELGFESEDETEGEDDEQEFEHAEDSFGEGDGDDGVAPATEQEPFDPEVGRIKVAMLYSGIDQKDIDQMSVGTLRALGARLFENASQQRDELSSSRESEARDKSFNDIIAERVERLSAEFGEEGAEELRGLVGDLMSRVEERFSRMPEESARHAEGQQAVLREVSRFEGLNPQLKGDGALRNRLIATAKALSESGAYPMGSQLFDAAARAMGLNVAPPSKPKTSTHDILKTQPNQSNKPSKKNAPKTADDWDQAWIRHRIDGKSDRSIRKLLGPRPE